MLQPTLSSQTVAVLGSGTEEHDDLASEVGDLLASLEVNVLTGGGLGVMTSVSRAFRRHRRGRGLCIGVIPCASEADRATPREGYPNGFVELAIFTHLPYSGRQGTLDLSRNHINVLSAAAIVGLPGDAGTLAEMTLAVRYRKPVIAYARRAEMIRHFPAEVPRAEHLIDVERFLRAHLRETV